MYMYGKESNSWLRRMYEYIVTVHLGKKKTCNKNNNNLYGSPVY